MRSRETNKWEFEFPFVHIYGYEDRPRTQASLLEGKQPQDVIDQRVKHLGKAQEEILEKSDRPISHLR